MNYHITLNADAEDPMVATGFRASWMRRTTIWLPIMCSGGLLGLIFYWRRDWYIKCTSTVCAVRDAEAIIAKGSDNQVYVCRVHDMRRFSKFYAPVPEGAIDMRLPLVNPTGSSPDDLALEEVPLMRYFDCKRVRYIWNDGRSEYCQLVGMQNFSPRQSNAASGLDLKSRSQRLRLFGLNKIAVRVDPIIKILFKEVLTPFYAFQLFSVTLWMFEEYYAYSGVIIGLSLLSLATQTYETRRQQTVLSSRVQDHDLVRVVQADGQVVLVSSETLVPGDVIEIDPNGCKVVCDSLLLTGTCIVNESALTGESVPVPKVPVTASDGEFKIDSKIHGRSMLFCGTKVLQGRPGGEQDVIRAVVVRTGYMTSKGKLIRGILFFRQVDFKFQVQTYWYIFALACIAVLGMVYSIIVSQAGNEKQRHTPQDTAVRTLDLITIIVPPALPAALTIGIFFSQWRLKKKSIFCISPRTINMCGLINMVCFDKTGTITEDGLDIKNILSVEDHDDKRRLTIVSDTESSGYSRLEQPVFRGMAVCHSLSVMSVDKPSISSGSERLIGDPLDLVMFKATKWVLSEAYDSRFGRDAFRSVHRNVLEKYQDKTSSLIIIREYPFASALQRMGVVVYNEADQSYEFFCKGAPETIVALCDHSTVPYDIHHNLRGFSSEGNRVIALAWKRIPHSTFDQISQIKRCDLERGLQLCGLVVLENRLKVDSAGVIAQLNAAAVRVAMLTGDNLHTAISVARNCGILSSKEIVKICHVGKLGVTFEPTEHPSDSGESVLEVVPQWHPKDLEARRFRERLAVSGDTLELVRKNYPDLLPKLLLEGAVFARVSPTDKQFLVESFVNAGYQVAMCGDGANDVGALKAAHVGISLSETEAAAAAPFVSTQQSLKCVLQILQEGRCALVTFYGIFFLMATYSMTQFITCILLYWIGQTMTDMHFLYQDLFELTILAVAFALALPYDRLTADYPPASLKSFPAIFSLIGHTALILIAQIVAYAIADQVLNCDTAYGFIEEENPDASANATSATVSSLKMGCQSYGLFPLGSLQIVILSFVFARGAPFRQQVWKNYIHVILAGIMVIFDLICMLGPTSDLLSGMEMNTSRDQGPRFIFLGITFGYLILALFFEKVLITWVIPKCLENRPTFKRLRDYRVVDVEDRLLARIELSKNAKGSDQFPTTYFNPAYVAD